MGKSFLNKVNDFLNMEVPMPFSARGKEEESLLVAIKESSINQETLGTEDIIEPNLEVPEAANEIMSSVEDDDIHQLENQISEEPEDDSFDINETSTESSDSWGSESTDWGESSFGDSSGGDSGWGESEPELNTDTSVEHNDGGNDYDMDIPEEDLKVQELLENNVLVQMEKELIELAEFDFDPIIYERYAELEYKRYQPKSYFLVPVDTYNF